MNPIQIYHWYPLKPHQLKKLKDMGVYEKNGMQYTNLSITEFVDKWQDSVMILAPTKYRTEWLIGVTGHVNFNQR